MKKILLIIPIAFLFTSCFKTKFIATDGITRHMPVPNYKKVVVYMQVSEVPENCERVGLITSRKRKTNKAFRNAKKAAADHGATSILFTDGRELNGGERMANIFLWPGTFKAKWKFIALKEK